MIRRVWWRICARFYAARAARSGQDAVWFQRKSEEFFRKLEAAE
jgi:hypothetical protein